MKKFLITGAVAFGVLYAPSVVEGTTNNCAALEHRVVRSTDNGFVPVLAALSNGNLAAMGASKQMPGVPTVLSCAAGYWFGIQ